MNFRSTGSFSIVRAKIQIFQTKIVPISFFHLNNGCVLSFSSCSASFRKSSFIFFKNPAYLQFLSQKQIFYPTPLQTPVKIGVKFAITFLSKSTKIFNFGASHILFPLPHPLLPQITFFGSPMKMPSNFLKDGGFSRKKIPPVTHNLNYRWDLSLLFLTLDLLISRSIRSIFLFSVESISAALVATSVVSLRFVPDELELFPRFHGLRLLDDGLK